MSRLALPIAWPWPLRSRPVSCSALWEKDRVIARFTPRWTCAVSLANVPFATPAPAVGPVLGLPAVGLLLVVLLVPGPLGAPSEPWLESTTLVAALVVEVSPSLLV